MATQTKLFTFVSSAEGFTGYPASSDVTLSYDSGVGNPAGSLKSRVFGRNKTGTDNYWEWSGTWEDLGVPSGYVITHVRLNSGYDRCTEWNVGGSGNFSGPFDIRDSAGTTVIATLWAGRSVTAVEGSWNSIGQQSDQTVSSTYEASNTSIKIRLYTDLANGNNASAAVSIQQDQIELVITYTSVTHNLTADNIVTEAAVIGDPTLTSGGGGGGLTYRFINSSSGTDDTAEGVLTGINDGDLMIAFLLHQSSDISVTPPSGWTLLEDDTNVADFSSRLYLRVKQNGDPTPVWTWSSVGNWIVDIMVWSGFDTSTPIDDSSFNMVAPANTISSSNVTSTIANAVLVWWASLDASSAAGRTWTQSGSPTEALDQVDLSFTRAIAYEVIPTTSTVSRDMTVTDTAQDLASYALLIRPQASGDNLTADNIVTDPAVLGSPTLGQTHILSSDNIVTDPAVLGSPTLGQTHILSSDNIVANDSIVSDPVIGQSHILISENITSEAAVISDPTLYSGITHNLVADNILTGDLIVTDPVIGQTHALSSDNIVTDPAIFSNPFFNQTHVLTSSNIVTEPAIISNPTISEVPPDDLIADNIVTDPTVLGSPTLTQTHILLSDGIVSEPVIFSNPDLGQTHILNSESIVTLPAIISDPSISEVLPDELIADNIVSGNPELGSPDLGQVHSLVSNNIEGGIPELSNPDLSEIHALIAQNIVTLSAILGNSFLGQTHILVSESIITGFVVISDPVFRSTATPTSESRIYVIYAEDRIMEIEVEDRTNRIEYENRILDINE